MPLNWDIFTTTMLSLINKYFFLGFYSTLNSNGVNAATLYVPPLDPQLAG